MVISMEQYAALRRDFLEIAKYNLAPVALVELKSFYSSAINSARDSDYIETIEDLIRILEKRGCIRWDNIIPLKHIAELYLKHSPIIEKLNDYNNWVKSFSYPYSPQTNLYRLKNGESHMTNTIINHPASHSNLNHNIHPSSRYKEISCLPPLNIVIREDLSDSNNSAVSTSLRNTLINNFCSNGNHNNEDNRIEDCKIDVVSYETFDIPQQSEDQVVSDLPLPSDLIFETDKKNKPSESTHSSVEDFDTTAKALPNTSLISTPWSLEPETVVCPSQINSLSSPCQSLKRSSLKNNVEIARNRFNRFITRKFIRIVLIVSPFAIILLYLIITFGFSKNPVNYNPKPSAPTFQETHTGYPQTSNYSYPGCGSQSNQSRNPTYNAPQEKSPPLQTLSEREAMIQTKVFERVSSELGPRWADMARYLEIRESDINDIDKRCSRSRDKAWAALQIFADETNLDYWQRTLKKALEKARRKDIIEHVDNILYTKF